MTKLRSLWLSLAPTVPSMPSAFMSRARSADHAFLTAVVRLLRILPAYSMFHREGRGETKVQPVYVEGVAEGLRE